MPFVPEDDLGGRVRVDSIDEDTWQLVEPLTYIGSQGDTFTVPAGYRTDYASVPRILVWYIAKSGRWTRAAILHDWLLTELVESGRLRSNDADGLFRAALRDLEVPPVKRRLMWVGVRWGALASPYRRLGWTRTAHQVIPISIIALPVFLPPVAVVSLALVVLGAVEALATKGRRRGTLTT